jgi:P2 family phage contractile tail tube protein
MATIYIQEAANLFIGDAGPANGKHLTLVEHKLPTLEEKIETYHPGGSIMEIGVALGLNKLESTFQLAGWDPELVREFGLGSKARNRYTSYGVIRDKKTNRAIESVAVLEGRLVKVEPTSFKRGELLNHDYSIDEIYHYELHFDGKELYFWDLFSGQYRINGINEHALEQQILRIA